jgi:hypothetical protein
MNSWLGADVLLDVLHTRLADHALHIHNAHTLSVHHKLRLDHLKTHSEHENTNHAMKIM